MYSVQVIMLHTCTCMTRLPNHTEVWLRYEAVGGAVYRPTVVGHQVRQGD
uniref:Uncharacterized protein n=1 Tax=Anguilla anguilla TaxID=7936 RepID=A0A0E9UL83_ANGAN